MPEQRRHSDPDTHTADDAPRYDRDEVALPIDTTFYTNADPQPADQAATADDASTSSSSPIDVQRLEAEIIEADRLLSPQAQEQVTPSP